ncbi:MAG: peptidoglycan-binding domain-containing protein [Minisyncoccia bacterium]
MKKYNEFKVAKIAIILLVLTVFGAFYSEASAQVSCLYLPKTLKFGLKQNKGEVIKLQDFLYKKGYLSIPPTGYFGKMTESAVKKFQIENGLEQVGVVGPLTRARINQISCLPQTISLPTSSLPESQVAQTASPVPSQTPVVGQIISNQNKDIALPYTSSNFSDWKKSWGKVSTSSTSVLVEANTDTYGAQTIFPSSNSLTDYRLNANIFVRRGSFILMARYVDDDNFLACSFGGRTVEIIQRIKGLSKTVASAYVSEMPNPTFFFSDINVSMSVIGKKVGCTVLGNQENVQYSNIDDSLLKGGIGIQNWNEALGVASLELKKVTLESI